MHKISKTELMKVNNATWIYVKVCIKSQTLKLELNFLREGFSKSKIFLILNVSQIRSEGGVIRFLFSPKFKKI